MPTISPGNRPMTVINVVTVSPELQMRLVELLTSRLRRASAASRVS
jgi:hypothetical protein